MDISFQDPTPEDAQASRRATAVALKKYGVTEDVLPKIVAAGYGKLAEQIVALAFQNGVKVREDKALAQMLAAIELDSEIPSDALIAVAEILAYVYKANGTYKPDTDKTDTGVPDIGTPDTGPRETGDTPK